MAKPSGKQAIRKQHSHSLRASLSLCASFALFTSLRMSCVVRSYTHPAIWVSRYIHTQPLCLLSGCVCTSAAHSQPARKNESGEVKDRSLCEGQLGVTPLTARSEKQERAARRPPTHPTTRACYNTPTQEARQGHVARQTS